MPRVFLQLKFACTQRGTLIACALLLASIASLAVCVQSRHAEPVATVDQEPAVPVAPAAPAAAAPPKFPAGLPADFFEQSREAYKAYPQPFRVRGDRSDLRRKTIYLWQAVLQVATARKPKGQHYTSGPQQTSDCVAWGKAAAIYYTLANALIAGNASGIDDPYQPALYGIARVTEGGGRPGCRSGGAYPSDAANGFINFGWPTYGEAGRDYSGRDADRMGCDGPPAALLAAAGKRAGGDCYPIRDVDELLEALHNGYAGTAGIPWSPGRERSISGRIVTQFNGSNQGGHQIAWVGWDGERQQAIFHNSHGPQAHGQNPGDPPGSFRVEAKTLEWMLQNGEFWAYSSVRGFPPQELDFSPLRPKSR